MTVRELCADPGLGLVVRAGEEHLDRHLTWAHVSELEDPAAFLSGGELLLTTGVSLPTDPRGVDEWVHRLVSAGIAAVGFGVGLRFTAVPDAVVAAARTEQLPLIEVPLAVPFIDLEKAVSQALSSDDHARLQRTHQQQRQLVRATLAADGARTLVYRTADLIGGWAAFLDASGQVRYSTKSKARSVIGSIAAQRARRPREVVFSSAGGEDVVSQPLTALDGRVLGYLVAGREGVVGSLDHGVVTMAASLLTLFVRRTDAAEGALARARSATLRLLLGGQVDAARSVAGQLWDVFPEEPVAVILGVGPDEAQDNAAALLGADGDGSAIFAEVDGVVVVVAPDAEVDTLVGRLTGVPNLHLGVSAGTSMPDLVRARREARLAVDDAVARGVAVARFGHVGSGGLTSYLDRERARGYAVSHLSVLGPGQDGDLLRTLHRWLACNGQIDPAARSLGIHRHTLRRRLERIEDLLGADLTAPTCRAELWLELELLDVGLLE